MKKTVGKWISYFSLFLCSCAMQDCAKAQSKTSSNTGTRFTHLVWQEEFDNPGLPDPLKWKFDTGYIRNNELQYYTYRRTENLMISNGMLEIIARNDSFSANHHLYPITSASITTEGLKDFTYGRLEIRAKIPSSLGTWPAIWTLGTNIHTVGWPTCGELDIMEHVGYIPDSLHFTEHALHADMGTRIYYPSPEKDFHIYAIEWYSDHIDWFFDGEKVFTFNKEPGGPWPYDKPQFILLNLAFGGDWGGLKGVNIPSLPQHFYIDYLRLYQ